MRYHFLKIKHFDQHFERIILFWHLHLQLVDAQELIHLRKQKIGQELIEIHQPLAIKKGELGRWLTLFRQSLEEFEQACPDEAIKHQAMLSLWKKKLDIFEHQFESAFFSGPA